MATAEKSIEPPVLHDAYVFGVKGEDFDGSIVYSREDTVLFTTGRQLCFHNVETRSQKSICPNEKLRKIRCFSVSHGNKYVALVEELLSDSKNPSVKEQVNVVIYKLTNMKRLRTLTGEESFYPKAIAFSKSGKHLVTVGSDEETTLIHWDWAKLKILGTAKVGGIVKNVSINPFFQDMILVSGPRVLKVFRYADSQLQVLTPSFKAADGTHTIAPGALGSELLVINGHVFLSPDRYAVASGDSSLCIFEGKSEVRRIASIFPEGHSIRSMRITRKGLMVAGDGGFFAMMESPREDPSSLGEARRYRIKQKESILGISLSASEDHVCFFLENQSVVQLDLGDIDLLSADDEAHAAIVMEGHRGRVNSVDIAIHRPFLFSLSGDGTARVWDYRKKESVLQKVFPDEPYCVSLHPSGNIVAISFRRKIVFYHLTMGDLIEIDEVDIKGCKTLKYSNGGHILAAVGGTSISLINSNTFHVMKSFRGHIGPVRAITWSPDDMRLVTTGYDGAVYEWNVLEATRVQEHIDKDFQYTGVVIGNFGHRYERPEDSGGSGGGGASEVVSSHPSSKSVPIKLNMSSPICPSTIIACGVGKNGSEIRMIERGEVTTVYRSDIAPDVLPSGIPRSAFTKLIVTNNGHTLFVGTAEGEISTIPLKNGKLPPTSHFRPIVREKSKDEGSGASAAPPGATPQEEEEEVIREDDPMHLIHSTNPAHSGMVRAFALSLDDTMLVSAGEEGTIKLYAVRYSGKGLVEAHKTGIDGKILERFDLLTVVPRSDFEELSTKIVDLEESISKTKQEMTFNARQREMELMANVREQQEIRKSEMIDRDAKIQSLEGVNAELREHMEQRIQEIEANQMKLREDLENAYELKLMAEVAKKDRIAQQKEEIQVVLEDRIESMRHAHQDELDALRSKYEEELINEKARFEQLLKDREYLFEENEETVFQMREEQDERLADIKRDSRKDLEKQKHVATSLREENFKLRNKFAQNRQELENLRKILKAKESQMRELELRAEEQQKMMDTLKREIRHRDESVMEKERQINVLKKRSQELEKFRLVFGYKLQALKKEIEPKDSQIDSLVAQVEEMETEFERETQDHGFLESQLRDKLMAIEALTKEVRNGQEKIMEKEKFISLLQTELTRAIELTDPSEWKEKIRDIYRRFVVSDTKIRAEEIDPEREKVKEFDRQRTFLERYGKSISHKVSHVESSSRSNAKKRLKENHQLMEEVNMLRRQNHDLFVQLKQLQSEQRMGILTGGAPPGASGSSGVGMPAIEKKGSGDVGRRKAASARDPRKKGFASLLGLEPSDRSSLRSAKFQKGRIARGSSLASSSLDKQTASQVSSLLTQIEENNRLIEMQRYEIKRLREQVQFLLEKTKEYSMMATMERRDEDDEDDDIREGDFRRSRPFGGSQMLREGASPEEKREHLSKMAELALSGKEPLDRCTDLIEDEQSRSSSVVRMEVPEDLSP
eukprot:TRINITY_DN222_c0_g1_i3.p1 TRINITY_DN222_c0_g1~~TRINITY_DN222_c0_g1_i3.p1  ORF type:complete len:1466 (-),score=513.63 TRINITY_DN222_c0_g1_i3:1193-5590(-)